MLDLKDLKQRIDKALEKETPESLTKWLDNKRQGNKMNHEFKFRGQRIDTKEWVCGYYFITPLTEENINCRLEDGAFFLTGKTRHCISRNGVVFEVIPETVGLYTGFPDKDGAEIYQGDKIEYRDGESYTQRVVEWDNGGFILTHIKSSDKFPHEVSYFIQMCKHQLSTKYKVIGNIYTEGK